MHDTAKRSVIQGLSQKRSVRAVVFDCGNVLCLEQTLEDMKGMALVCGIPHERFSELYWKLRPPYDRGEIDGPAYWTAVVGQQELDLSRNYRQDPYYAPIVRVVEDLLREKGFVAPVELFIRMNLLSPESAEDWRRGQISYLERVIRCNLSKASRILRILRMHAHDLDLKPSLTVYKRRTKGSRPLLRFSKTGNHNIEEAYARHFVSPRRKGCPFEAGAIDVCNSAEISQARGSSTQREIQKG